MLTFRPNFFSGLFGDKRLEERGSSVLRQLVLGKSSSIRKIFADRAGQKGCYRFLNNSKVSEESLIEEVRNRCIDLVSGRHLLVIQDSTSFNLHSHSSRLKKGCGIGTIEDNRSLGFFMHASMVIDAFSGNMLGFSDVHLWHRLYQDPDRGKRTGSLPIEEKESYKWIRACERTKELLSGATGITFVEDRDGDIYEQFARVADEKCHYVIRGCKDRKLSGGSKLYETIGKEPVCGSYTILVGEEKRTKRAARKAVINVRFKKVSLKKPERCINKNIPDFFELYMVEALEEGYSGKDKICWRLFTSHELSSYEDAVQIIEIYRKRWYVEQLFRLLKKQGFGMEECQLEEGWAIRKLAVLALSATLRIMQLMLATEEETQPINEVFSKEEQECLYRLSHKVNGKTEKLINPYKAGSLIWAKWIIARLGGWKGYRSQRIPGPITLKRGLDKFTQIFEGWCLALELQKNVGTQ